MSRSKRHVNNAVSLFPFLAVLVCVLGGLILLLVINTRRMRMQGLEAAALVALQDDVSERQEPVLVPPSSVEDETVPDPPSAAPREDIENLPATGFDDTSDNEATAADPVASEFPVEANASAMMDDELKSSDASLQVAALERDIEELKRTRQTRLESHGELTRELKHSIDRQNDQIQEVNRLDSALSEFSRQRDDLARQNQGLEREQERLTARMEETQREIARARRNKALKSDRYSIIPYNGKTGTSRRPILIECTSRSIRFLPEDIELTPRDLDGFTPGINPLLAGTQTLIAYWTAWQRMHPEQGVDAEPYVMLIVRPSGSVAYYIARKMLDSLSQPYGYELIGENWELDLPEVDRRAKQECQAAIDNLLKQRDSIRREVESRPYRDQSPIELNHEKNIFDLEDPESVVPRRRTDDYGGARDENYNDDQMTDAVEGDELASQDDELLNASPMLSRNLPGERELPPSRFIESEQDRRIDRESNLKNDTTTASDATGNNKKTGEVVPPLPQASDVRDDERSDLTIFDKVTEFPHLDGVLPDLADQPQRFGDEYEFRQYKTDKMYLPTDQMQPVTEGIPGQPADQYRYGDEVPIVDGDKKTFGPPSEHSSPADTNFADRSGSNSSTDDPARERGSSTAGRKAKADGDNSPHSRTRSSTRSLFDANELLDGDVNQERANRSTSRSSADGTGRKSPLIMDIGKPQRSHRGGAEIRRWGEAAPGATIGFERDLVIEVYADRASIGASRKVMMQGETPNRDEFKLAVIDAIDQEVRAWREAPPGFYWVPKVQFHVAEGGSGTYEQLQNELRGLGLATTVTHGVENRPEPTARSPQSTFNSTGRQPVKSPTRRR